MSDPYAPFEAGFATLQAAIGVAVAGGYAYVADYDAGLRIIDVWDPSDPFEAGFYNTPGDALGVAVAGGYAYVADNYGGLIILRFTEPTPMFVQFIYLTPIEPLPGLELVLGLVRIVDENLDAVPGATVDLEWTLPGGYPVPQSKPTNSNGMAVTPMWGFWPGTYQLCVTDVTAEGYVYDPDQNLETCETIALP